VRPLVGVEVVSLALNVPGPVATARLHALGAAVTKVEPPDGDPLARSSHEWYDQLAAGQQVLRLDLKEPSARAELDQLLEEADLLLTAQRPAALARLGLVWDDLHGRFPQLCWVAIVGNPAPGQNRAGHDLTYVAKRGLLAPPEVPRTMIADLGGAERAVSASLTALLARERRSEASYVEVALSDAADLFAEPLRRGLTAPDGPLGGGLAVYGLYETGEGWIAVAALEPSFRRRLAEELELSEPTRPALERAFRGRTAAEWEAWALERDLPIEAVRDP
jgi:alpha-methylacyl-CoA racemase